MDSNGTGLIYSTFLGGTGTERGLGIFVDGAGNAYITGQTFSEDFPVTLESFQTISGGGGDAFLTKLDPTGSSLVYSTYLGGTGEERSNDIAVDGTGNAYVTGQTSSPDFPTTPGAFQTAPAGSGDAFITKLNALGGTLFYSTFLGGSDSDLGNSIVLDAAGNAYVMGQTRSPDFPTTTGAFDVTLSGVNDVFVTKVDPTGSMLVYSTFLGGTGGELASVNAGSIAVDATGNAYVVGETSSSDFPTTPGAPQTTSGGGSDAFVTKLNPTGTSLVYSTFLGGISSDFGDGIAVDTAGNAYVTGGTGSTDFTTTPGAFQTTLGGGSDAFIAKIADQPLPIEVVIDIKPGSFPNSINLGSNGTVPVAIFSDTAFDATTVDPTTVTLASAPVKLKGNGTLMASFKDVNGDGLMDLVVHVSTQALQLTNTDTEAQIEGQTYDGASIQGTDSVRVVQ